MTYLGGFIIIGVKGLSILIGWVPTWQHLLLAQSLERERWENPATLPCTIDVSCGAFARFS
jgi:hypothetical protein